MYQQVKDINLSKESPCGHGIVTCFSIYGGRSGSGEACNFAADPGGPPQDRLWVDTMLDDQVCHSLLVLPCITVLYEMPLCYDCVICTKKSIGNNSWKQQYESHRVRCTAEYCYFHVAQDRLLQRKI